MTNVVPFGFPTGVLMDKLTYKDFLSRLGEVQLQPQRWQLPRDNVLRLRAAFCI